MEKDFSTLPASFQRAWNFHYSLTQFQIPISFKDVLFVLCCFDMSFSGDEVMECAGKQVVQ